MNDKQKDKVFDQLNYRVFLAFALETLKDGGMSLREVCRRCAIKSPNFFQQILSENRDLTPSAAVNVASGIGLKGINAEYFIELVKLSYKKTRNPEAVLANLKELENKKFRKEVRDPSIYSHWVNAVIFELCKMKGLRINADTVHALLGGTAEKKDIENGIELLKKKQWIVLEQEPDYYRQNDVEFQFLDDGVRRVDVQRNHLHYLNLAQHRIHEDIPERCFKGLTVAIPKDKFAWFKEEIDAFFDKIDKVAEASTGVNSLIRVQLASYYIVKKEKLDQFKK